MPYSQFTLLGAKKSFSLHNTSQILFPNVEPVSPSEWLTETLRKTISVAYVSDKARSEATEHPYLSN